MKEIKVEIITIGDEILIGQIVDTNSAWMATELNAFGFQVAQITSVHDDAKHIVQALDLALTRADVVLFTGGIGPTKDDITKQTLCAYFHTELVFNADVLANIERLFAHRPNFMNELNKQQALVPKLATILPNDMGTAPITWFDHEGKVVVSMPGVPYEMKQVMTTQVLPRLQKQFQTPAIFHQTVQVYGYAESALALKIADWENALPENIHLAYLPNFLIVKLRLSGYGDDIAVVQQSVEEQLEVLKGILGDAIIIFEDIAIEKYIAALLTQRGLTIATAESCTGGNIAHRFTSLAGSSSYFKGSVVAYANAVKTDVLGVNILDINQFGAVSQSVVEQMAEGVRRLLNTDIAIATSGVAGPTGGTDDKPVGTVWIAVCSSEKMISRLFRFGGQREQNIERSTQAALLMVRELLY